MEKFERKRFGAVISTESALAGVKMSSFRHVVYYDYSPGMLSVGSCALQHASITFFLQPSEHLAVDVLQLVGMPLKHTAADLREFHMECERGKRTSIEKVPPLPPSCACRRRIPRERLSANCGPSDRSRPERRHFLLYCCSMHAWKWNRGRSACDTRGHHSTP